MTTGTRAAGIRRRAAAAAAAALIGIAGTLLVPSGSTPTGADAAPAPIEHLRGIYLQQAIELATVGTRTVLITRMTRFSRCGRVRGTAEEFNEHFVDVAGLDVPGLGFVAGIVDSIDGCSPATARARGMAE
jgi:hypothetical protein